MAKLPAKQLRVIEILLTGSSISAAARTAGISRTTLHTWLGDEQFRAELNNSTNAILDAAVMRLSALAESAIDTLSEIMTNKKMHPSSRVRAAEVILNRLLVMREMLEFESRLAALEKRL